MRRAFSLIVLLGMGLVAPVVAQPLNQQPMYGNQPKTPQMLAADADFLANAARFGTRPQTSDRSMALGWQYFQRKDLAAAMTRFNQAWLLDPDNGDAFHGFAILVMERDKDAAQADTLFQQGIAKPRQSPGIWLDYGRFLMMARRPSDAVVPLRKAVSFPDMGPDAQALLTLSLYESGEAASACAERFKVRESAQASLRAAVEKLVCKNQ